MGLGLIHRLNRVVAVGVSLVFGVQCVFAYQPEKKFWEARRAVARATRSGDLVHAAFPAKPFSSLVTQFPSLQSVPSFLSPSQSRSQPAPLLNEHGDLLAALSPAHGTVRKVWPGGLSGKGRLVVHVQDVHQNAEAQWNIREAVSDLLKSGEVGLVALEGSAEAIDLQPFVDFSHKKALKTMADYFLKENKISGPIHAALTAEGRLPPIRGIDDPVHYEANVQAVRDSAPMADSIRRFLMARQAEIENQKAEVFPPALRAFDRTVSDYRADKIPLGIYVEALSGTLPPDSLPFSVQRFIQVLKTERTLNFNQVEAERALLIEKLTQTLSPSEIKGLMGESLAFRAGQRRISEFYGRLTGLCQGKGMRLGEYPAMDLYVRYVLSADAIDPETLLKDLAALEKKAYARLAEGTDALNLIQQSRQVWLAGRLANFSLTPLEWNEWTMATPLFLPDLSTFEAFYREAQARDGAMADNLWAEMKEKEVAVLVTGGFHADGVDRELVRRGVTVISYVPKIKMVDTDIGAVSLSVFTQEKTPLEKLFRGEKLFLSPNPIAPVERKIQMPLVVMLLALLMGGQLDPQLTYQSLGGIGLVKELVLESGVAQAALVLGAGTLIFRCFLKGDALNKVVSVPKNPSLWSEFKIKVWDPLREQVKYYLPWVIVVPFILSLWGTALFDGGLGMLISFYSLFGSAGLIVMVPIFIEREHEKYSLQEKYALIGEALWIGVLTMGAFMGSFSLLSPLGFNLIASTDLFSALLPNGELKAFGFAGLLGFLTGFLEHIVHNKKAYDNLKELIHIPSNGPNRLLPLSRSAAGRKALPIPSFSGVKLHLPPAMDKRRFLDSLYVWGGLNLNGKSVDPQALTALISKLEEFNPLFCAANRELLADRDRLSKNPSLVKQIINSALFLPLNAHAIGFAYPLQRWVGLSELWEGYFYLGEEIWLAVPEEGTEWTDLIVNYGIGVLPTAKYARLGESFVNSFVRKKESELTPNERLNLVEWGKWVGEAILERNRGILLRLLTDDAYASRVSREDEYNPKPSIKEIVDSVLRDQSDFSWKNFDMDAPLYVAARLQGLAQGLAYLKAKKQPFLGILLFKAELKKFLGEKAVSERGRLNAIRDFVHGFLDRLEPILQYEKEGKDHEALDAAIALLQSVLDDHFLSYGERFERVFGKKPGAHDLELTRIGIQQKNLSILLKKEVRGSKPLVQTQRDPGADRSTEGKIISGIEKISEGAVTPSGEETRPPLPIESFTERLGEGETIESVMSAILTLRWVYSSGELTPQEEGDLEGHLKNLQVKLWGLVRLSPGPVADLLSCAKALDIENDDLLFLQKYRDIQKSGRLPTYSDMAMVLNAEEEDRVLDAHDRLVRKLGNWDLLPVGFPEMEGEDIANEIVDPGELGSVMREGFEVLVYEDDFKKGVKDNASGQKAVLNAVKTLRQRWEEAPANGKVLLTKSRSGLYERNVHNFWTNGHNVFVKLVGKKMVVLWVAPVGLSHAARSLKADRNVGIEIARRADAFSGEAGKYVLLNADFSRTGAAIKTAPPIHTQLPDIDALETVPASDSDSETEVARFRVSVGGDTFIVSHTIASPLRHYQWGFTPFPTERLTVETFMRDGKRIEIPPGPHGVLEFVPHRRGKNTELIEAEMRHGIPHLFGEKPYNAGSVLMAILLKKVAGPKVPVRAVLAMTNATALFHLISAARKEGREFTFSQLQKVPAFRIPECLYTFKINDNGVAEYTVAWSGVPGSPSDINSETAERLRTQDNFSKFIRVNEGSNFIRDFGNTSSGKGGRPFNVFQLAHERFSDDRGSFIKEGIYWLTHPFVGGPFLEGLGYLFGVYGMGTWVSQSGWVNPEWFVSVLAGLGWMDPTGSVFFSTIFIAAIFSLLHPDLWKDPRRGLKEIQFFGLFARRFVGELFFVFLLQVPLLSSVFPALFPNIILGLILSFSVHSVLNWSIVSTQKGPLAAILSWIFPEQGEVEASPLVPETGPPSR
jgi:hypothetical protein